MQAGQSTRRCGRGHGACYALARAPLHCSCSSSHHNVPRSISRCCLWRGAPSLIAFHLRHTACTVASLFASRQACALPADRQVSFCTGSSVTSPAHDARQVNLGVPRMWLQLTQPCLQAFWERSSSVKKVVHAMLSLWVVGNILFNYSMGIMTAPGTTLAISREVSHLQPPSLPHGMHVARAPSAHMQLCTAALLQHSSCICMSPWHICTWCSACVAGQQVAGT